MLSVSGEQTAWGHMYLIAYLQYTVTHVYSTLFYGDMYIYKEGTYCVSHVQ